VSEEFQSYNSQITTMKFEFKTFDGNDGFNPILVKLEQFLTCSGSIQFSQGFNPILVKLQRIS
jgi:hypothetical protein